MGERDSSGRARVLLVAPASDVAPGWIELDREAAPAEPLGGDQRRARAEERVVDDLAPLRVVADRDLREHDGLLGRMLGCRIRAAATAAVDHDRGARSPDGVLLSAALPVCPGAL